MDSVWSGQYIFCPDVAKAIDGLQFDDITGRVSCENHQFMSYSESGFHLLFYLLS